MIEPDEQSAPEEPTPAEEAAPEEESFPEEPGAAEESAFEQASSSGEPGPAAEASEEVSFPEETILPDDFTPISEARRVARSRRRQAHRRLVPPADERAAILSDLARRSIPSFEFFLFAFFAGIILGVGYLLDLKINSQAIFLLGILLVPLLTPWVGMTLAVITGSWRFFFMTLGVLLVAGLLVFLTGALAGLAGRLWLPPPPFFQADIRTHIWWMDLFIVVLGAVLLTISFVRSEQKPILPSLMLAYGLFMPVSAAGFGLGIGQATIWQNGVQVFLLHLALSTIVGGIVLINLKFKPLKASGYLLPFLIGLLCLAGLVTFTGLVNVVRDGILATRHVAAPTLTVTPVPPSKTPTPTFTLTPSFTATATNTSLPTATPEPTPAYGIITSPSGGGALVYSNPGSGTVVTTLLNGIIVQILPETQTGDDGRTWVHIISNSSDGWVLATVLTPTENTPPPTLTLTPIP